MPETLDELRPDLRSGDPEAYRLLVRELSEPLFRYVRPMLKDDGQAQDVVQQTFLRVFKNRRRLKREGSIRSFCFFIATNLVRDSKRRQATRRKHESEAAEMQRSTEPDHAERVSAKEAFAMAMELPLELREVVLLRIGQGFTAAETADMLGIPEGTVKTRQRTALEKLRARLLSTAPAVGLADLEDSVGEGAKTSVQVPTSLVTNVEALVMANVGTHAGVAIGILAGAFVLLLIGAGVAVGASLFLSESEPHNVAPIEISGEDTDSGPLGAGNSEGEIQNSSERNPETVNENDGPAADNGGREGEASANDGQLTFRVRGRVIDEQGIGVAGAWITTSKPETSSGLETRFHGLVKAGSAVMGDREIEVARLAAEGASSPGTLTPVECANPAGVYSDAQGYFDVELFTEPNGTTVAFQLAAFAEGYRGDSWRLTSNIQDGDVVEQSFRLRTLDRYLTFRTKPVLRETLDIRMFTGVGTLTSSSGYTSTPGPDGLHQVSLDQELVDSIKFKARDYVITEAAIDDSGQRHVEAGTIELDAGRTFEGIVVDEEGRPIGGALLRSVDYFSSYTESDALGRFTFNGLREDDIHLTARHADYASVKKILTVDDADNRIVMPVGFSVTGLVRFQGQATPAAEEELRVVLVRGTDANVMRDITFRRLPGVEVDETGAFAFEHIGPGIYTARGVMGDFDAKLSVPVPVDVTDSDVRIEIVFGAGGTVSGLVIGKDGQPLSDARIALMNFSNELAPNQLNGRTDSQGRYLFEDVEPGRYVVLLEEYDSNLSEALFARRTVELGENAVRFDIDLSGKLPGNVISGRITLDGQSAFRECYVMGRGLNTGLWRGRPDAEGRFEIAGIPPGDYYVFAGGSKPHMSARFPVSFDGWDGEEVIEKSLASAELTIKVEAAPEVSSRAIVKLDPLRDNKFGQDLYQSLSSRQIEGNEAGVFKERLVAGRYAVTVEAPGCATLTRVVDVTADTLLDLTLSEEFGDVSFNFETDENTSNVSQHHRYMIARLYLIDGVNTALYGEMLPLNNTARYAPPALAPGSYRIEVVGPATIPLVKDFTVKAGEQETILLKPRTGARITLAFSDETVPLDAIQSASIEVRDAQDEPVRFDGTANPLFLGGGQPQPGRDRVVSPLDAGTYTITVEVFGYEPAVLEIQVSDGDVKTVPVTLTRK